MMLPAPARWLAKSAFGLAMAWALLLQTSQAHPAHAEEPETPFIGAFERFYSEQDSPEYLAGGGRLLLNELNCVTCHQPPAELQAEYPGVVGPDLRGIGSRMEDPAALQLLIRNPRFLKRGTIMPSHFAAPDRDEEVIESIFHYLLTLQEPVPALETTGDPDRGRELYHTLGCVACHAPGLEYVPPALPEGAKLELPAFPSHPIRLASYWSEEALVHYLKEPTQFHPSGRMPNFGLSDTEAADIAAYLRVNETEEAEGLPEPDLAKAKLGQIAFAAKGCASCHDTGEDLQPIQATPLLELKGSSGGCLSDRPLPGGIPHFFFSETQRQALQLGITSLAEGAPESDPLDTALSRQNCIACHSYDGRGGPELAREPYFGAGNPRALDREEFLPPDLKGVLERRSHSELLDIFLGQADERRYPKVKARMPVVSPDAAEEWLDLFPAE